MKARGVPGILAFAAGVSGLALLLPGCAGRTSSADTAAEAACRVQVGAVIDSGQCDTYQAVEDCPAFVRALESCP